MGYVPGCSGIFHVPDFIDGLAQVYRDKLDRILKEAEGQYPVLLHLPLKIVVFSKIQCRYIGTSGSSVSFVVYID